MTKMEHTRRTEEYVELLKKEKAEREKAKRREPTTVAVKALIKAPQEAPQEPTKKKKKRRGKGRKRTDVEDEEAAGGEAKVPSDTKDEAASHDRIPDTPSQAEAVSLKAYGHLRFDD